MLHMKWNKNELKNKRIKSDNKLNEFHNNWNNAIGNQNTLNLKWREMHQTILSFLFGNWA